MFSGVLDAANNQCCPTVLVPHIHIRPRVQQHLDVLGSAILRRRHQCCPTVLVPRIHIRARVQQHLDVLGSARTPQTSVLCNRSRSAHSDPRLRPNNTLMFSGVLDAANISVCPTVLVPHIHIRPRVQQHLQVLRSAILRRRHQCCRTVLDAAAHSHPPPASKQHLEALGSAKPSPPAAVLSQPSLAPAHSHPPPRPAAP